jgi:hypothetical protein
MKISNAVKSGSVWAVALKNSFIKTIKKDNTREDNFACPKTKDTRPVSIKK